MFTFLLFVLGLVQWGRDSLSHGRVRGYLASSARGQATVSWDNHHSHRSERGCTNSTASSFFRVSVVPLSHRLLPYRVVLGRSKQPLLSVHPSIHPSIHPSKPKPSASLPHPSPPNPHSPDHYVSPSPSLSHRPITNPHSSLHASTSHSPPFDSVPPIPFSFSFPLLSDHVPATRREQWRFRLVFRGLPLLFARGIGVW